MSKNSASKKQQQLHAKNEHEKFLKKYGVDDESLKRKLYNEYGRRKNVNDIPDYKTGPRVTSDKIASNGNKRETQKYTGNYIIGAATMHKSNCIPITSKQQAIDVSTMRRN
jgi:hypothetical protein